MVPISDIEKQRIIQFIEFNDLEFDIINFNVLKFRIKYENIEFQFYKFNDKYVVVKYDSKKDELGRSELQAYEYFHYDNILQILDQLKNFSDVIPKFYYSPIMDTSQQVFTGSYVDDWYKDFFKEPEYTSVKNYQDMYDYLVYDNPNITPYIKSPWNTLSDVSSLYSQESQFICVHKLYYEIHPISLISRKETYLFRLLSNNDDKFTEYINYTVNKKIGLEKLISDIFDSIKINDR